MKLKNKSKNAAILPKTDIDYLNHNFEDRDEFLDNIDFSGTCTSDMLRSTSKSNFIQKNIKHSTKLKPINSEDLEDSTGIQNNQQKQKRKRRKRHLDKYWDPLERELMEMIEDDVEELIAIDSREIEPRPPEITVPFEDSSKLNPLKSHDLLWKTQTKIDKKVPKQIQQTFLEEVDEMNFMELTRSDFYGGELELDDQYHRPSYSVDQNRLEHEEQRAIERGNTHSAQKYHQPPMNTIVEENLSMNNSSMVQPIYPIEVEVDPELTSNDKLSFNNTIGKFTYDPQADTFYKINDDEDNFMRRMPVPGPPKKENNVKMIKVNTGNNFPLDTENSMGISKTSSYNKVDND